MAKGYKILRAFLVAIITLPPVFAVGFYILLSLPWAQEALRETARRDLSTLLGTNVEIGSVGIFPFDAVEIRGLSVNDDYGAEALKVDKLTAGIDLYRLITGRRIVVDYAAISGLKASIYKVSPDGRLNIAGIIERLQPKEKKKTKTSFDLKINTFVIDDACVNYFENDADAPIPDKFDRRHIRLYDLNMAVNIPKLSDNETLVNLYSLNLKERSGFEISNLKASFVISEDSIGLTDLSIVLPNTQIETGSIKLSKKEIADIASNAKRLPKGMNLPVQIKEGSHITPSDISAFLPAATYADFPIYVTLDASVKDRTANIYTFRVFEPNNNLLFDLEGHATDFLNKDSMSVDMPSIRMTADGKNVAAYLKENFPMTRKAIPYLVSLGGIEFNGAIHGNISKGARFSGNVLTDAGDLDINARVRIPGKWSRKQVYADFSTQAFDLGSVLPDRQLGFFSGGGKADLNIIGKHIEGSAEVDVKEIEYKGYVYNGITASVARKGDIVDASVITDDPNARISAKGWINLDPDIPELELACTLDEVRPDTLNLFDRFPGHALSAQIDAHFLGSSIEEADGELTLKDLAFVDDTDKGVHINQIKINAYHSESPSHIDISSDFLSGSIQGKYDFAAIVPMGMQIVSGLFPALIDTDNSQVVEQMEKDGRRNQFELELTLKPHGELYTFLNLPVNIISDTDINLRFDNIAQRIAFITETHYLQRDEDKVLYDSALSLFVNGKDNAVIYATTSFQTKKGMMSVVLTSQGNNDRLNTRIDWEIARSIPINGIIDLTTTFQREMHLDCDTDSDKLPGLPLLTEVHFNPSQITFGETLWNILPGNIQLRKNDITVNRFGLMAGNESIGIDGRVSHDPDDILEVDLKSMQLIDIFETLQIDKALIGGKATGRVYGSSLMSRQPIITAPQLTVDSISYNSCVLGNAKVTAEFDTDTQAFSLNADIAQFNGHKSRIFGKIFAGRSYLDITFDTDKVNIGFLKPFMSTFANDISGVASGRARLFGTFKNVDLEGDILADSVNMGIAITNTAYNVVNDSLHIRPGIIKFDNITLHDKAGHTARLNGVLTHNYFHDAAFTFNITDVNDMLVFDTSERINPRWFGHILGSGKATITGEPGIVNISVTMDTDPGSWFTFALLDMVDANEYTFLNFRDRTKYRIIDSLIEIDDTPEVVKAIETKAKKAKEADKASAYNVHLDIGVREQTRMKLLMDPTSGDSIKAFGTGKLLLNYGSANESLSITGTYKINQGKYNFKMQDIIVKEFNILEGSSISFRGNPDAAVLDVKASYSVKNANLADLDPSFLEDKDLNKSTVPVNAIIHATGDVRQPDIDYSIEFPKSPLDVQRRALSIIGSQEMKERQILYLLALDRFYTPDYMASTRSNNELLSAASSTVSSQIGNMLGSISENWSVAPNLRSERGDFSDVEVNVALTSHLLDNRLIFNGNFGYRDPSLNTNQFIGDFDIEYLLNPAGTWRLKAYNRYNDQNYFLRSATTTQGVGIVYTRDFNNMFGFLRKKKTKQDTTEDDSEQRESVNDGDAADSPE